MQDVKNCPREKIIAGDFNAKSSEWNSPKTDARGTILMEWISTLNLVIQNMGNKPTFVRKATKSFIDVTLASERVAKIITNWSVLDDETLTEHKFIEFTIGNKSANNQVKKPIALDWEICNTLIHTLITDENTPNVKEYKKIVEEIFKSSKKNAGYRRDVPYWWTTDIAKTRNDCISQRRTITRMHAKKH